jgi:hypothetical protein
MRNPQYFRKATEYRDMFARHFEIVAEGNIRIFEEVFNNPNQRYWLLAPKQTSG